MLENYVVYPKRIFDRKVNVVALHRFEVLKDESTAEFRPLLTRNLPLYDPHEAMLVTQLELGFSQ